MDPTIARSLWKLLEPVHATVYFAEDAKPSYEAIGLKGGWMGYFASRSAAMGTPAPEIVAALFYNFHPRMVHRALPDAWGFARRDEILAARARIADRVLRRAWGPDVTEAKVREAARLALEAVAAAPGQGRTLFAAHRALAVPDEPHLALWHAATCLREHRGDGHVAALTVAGIDGCEANVIMAALGRVSPETQRSNRGWSEEEWAEATERLHERGLMEEDKLTPAGADQREQIEQVTDELALSAFTALGERGTAALRAALEPLTQELLGRKTMPFPNAIGMPRPGG